MATGHALAAPPPLLYRDTAMDDGTSASGSLFRLRAFRLLFTTRVCSNGANQMQAVAVGWQVYALTGSPLQLGLIGLVQFLPPLLLTLVVGQVVDRYDRRVILRCAYVVEFSVAASLLLLTALPDPPVAGIFAVLFVNAVARTFEVRAWARCCPRWCRARCSGAPSQRMPAPTRRRCSSALRSAACSMSSGRTSIIPSVWGWC